MQRQVNVAVCGPLTGPRSAYGEMLKTECERMKQVNVHLQYFDDMADPGQALTVAKEVIKKKMDVVIGHFNSQCSLTVKELYRDARIAFISPLSTNADLMFEQGGALFSPSDEEQLQTLANFIINKGKTIYVFCDDSPYSKVLVAQLTKALSKQRQTKDESSPKHYVLDDVKQLESKEIGNALVFLAGAHCNLVQPHKQLRMSYPELMIVGCDDCYVDEYLDELMETVNHNDYIIGQTGGHSGSLRKAVQYLIELLCSIPDNTSIFNVIGKSGMGYQFLPDGRLASSKWQLLPLQRLVTSGSDVLNEGINDA